MDLYYEVNGKGHPVVLVTGGADVRNWTFVTSLLAKHYKVVAFDGRGTGKSPSPLEDVNHVEDLLSLLDHLDINQATLIGHSMGGQIATEFALDYPERVSNLVLLAPGLSGFSYSKEFEEKIKAVHEAAPDIDKMVELLISDPSYRVVTGSPHRNLMVQMLRHHMSRMFEWPAVKIILSQPPAIERLGELTAKTLLIIGKEDSPDNLRVANYFRNHSDAQIIEIPDADHMLNLTHPEKLYQQIIGFMKE
ncbi:alpha/beta hydrolase [Halobacillus shinanisalinarum]|uniref:Alpha/beta hydrolase n=1 Tax=Halobacillus shinanisalinarum TaxID=2932258 RepID=A0ABY4GVZ9_9BACI|nr:alpha/beta hydrolase [Halobacillus shinanisalinarum]UOQ92214.1 alpha/beta hydrolase [Halobacillus shinanisalinarum]